MKTYAVRATKGEKNLYYLLFMNTIADEDVILIRMADLIEKSNKIEFDDISAWPLRSTNEILENSFPVQSKDISWFFPKKISKEQWEHYVNTLLCDHYTVTTDRTVIV